MYEHEIKEGILNKINSKFTMDIMWRPLYRLFTDLGCKT